MNTNTYTITDAEVETVDGSSYLHLRLTPTKGRDPEYRSICIASNSTPMAETVGQSELSQLMRVVGLRKAMTDSSELKGKKVRMRRHDWRVDWLPFSDDAMASEFFSRRDAAPKAA